MEVVPQQASSDAHACKNDVATGAVVATAFKALGSNPAKSLNRASTSSGEVEDRPPTPEEQGKDRTLSRSDVDPPGGAAVCTRCAGGWSMQAREALVPGVSK